ncbi:MAG: type II and III secretion system protein [Bryobacteraceae bacterium]
MPQEYQGVYFPARLRHASRQSFVRVLPLTLVFCLAANTWASEASDLFKKGRKAEKAGQIARAYLMYTAAASLDPNNHEYWSRSQALQTRAALEAKISPQLAAALQHSEADEAEDPAEVLQAATARDLEEARKPLPPTELKGQPLRKDFQLRGDAKTLFDTVAKAYGLDCVFDGDYQPARNIRFQMDDADYREALHGLEAVTGSFIVPLSDKLFMVVKDTPEKRKQEEPYAAIIVPLPEPTSTQDLTAMITAVQQACGIQKVAWDSQQNVVVMRDAISKIVPARQLFEDLLHPRAQVQFEMRFVEVSKSDTLKYGLSLPTSFPLYALSTFMNSAPKLASNLSGVLLFGGGSSLFGLGIANASLVASLSRSSGNVLLQASARSMDGQAATIHVGQRYPILTAGYFGPANFSRNGAYTPPPSFNFEDLGLSMKATPHVHDLHTVTLSLEAEFKVLAGAAVNGIPVISNRSLKSDVTLKMGEWVVVAGLLQSQDARTIAGIAGASNVPLLGPLTRTTTHTTSEDNVLIMLRPSLLTPPPGEIVTHSFRMGSETRPLTPL